MRRTLQRGIAYIEFALSLLVLIPMLLGVVGIGLSMHRQLQTVQLARDAGHMFARNVDFTQTGNQQVLSAVAGNLGLTATGGAVGTSGAGTAVVILSEVRYVDVSACTLAGKVDSHGNPSGCTNYQQWVFSERWVIGNSALWSSNLGTPAASIVSTVASNGVPAGTISIINQVTNTTDVANITGFNPWNSTTSTGLPSGQWVYVAEAAATGFQMAPFSQGTNTYAQIYF
ncbi:MAG: TadE family protein [Bryobacteraceae bacterium]